jgi:hypothetical protein
VDLYLWNIFHEWQFALEKVRQHWAPKSPEWLHIMSRIFDICALRSATEDGPGI